MSIPIPVVVTVPPAPETVMVLRRVLLSIAAGSDLPLDRLDDLILAVTEGAAAVMEGGGDGDLNMEVARTEASLDVLLVGPEEAGPWPDTWVGGLAASVMEATTSSVTVTMDGSRRSLAFSVEV